MREYIEILSLVIIGILFLWFGYNLLVGKFSPFFPWLPWSKRLEKEDTVGKPGEPQVCLVCSVKLEKGELVKSFVFPPKDDNKDRIMYIRGCQICLNNNIKRKCPVCKTLLGLDDYLVSRMFERPKRKNHVHITGCNHCKKTGNFPW